MFDPSLVGSVRADAKVRIPTMVKAIELLEATEILSDLIIHGVTIIFAFLILNASMGSYTIIIYRSKIHRCFGSVTHDAALAEF